MAIRLLAMTLCLCVVAMPNLASLAYAEAASGAALEPSRAAVTQRLIQLGLNPAQAQERVAQLSAAELTQLAAQPDLLQSAGHVSTHTVVLVILVVVAVVAIASIAS